MASHSTIGRWMAVRISVDPPGVNGYAFANTAPATKTAARPAMPFLLNPRLQMKYTARNGRTKRLRFRA